MARYCDSLLKKSNRTIDDASTEEKFNQIMIVFKYIDDKDVFQKFYSKMFANRLIRDVYASDDAEESMITKLKGNPQLCFSKFFILHLRILTDSVGVKNNEIS